MKKESAMPSRRQFLTTAAAALAVGSTRAWATGQHREIKSPVNGPIGLQLWSLRNYLPKDLGGTLKQIRSMGFREVEGAGLWNQTVGDLRKAMDAAGLRCQSAHMGLDRLRDDLSGALTEAQALGATWVVCPWIQPKVTRDDIMKAADVFNKAAAGARARNMRFGYHLHGYEFVPSTEGTLYDTLVKNTDPKGVEFQVDVFHTFHGGGDPVKVINELGARVTSLHLKDLKKGAPVVAGQPTGTPDIDVPLGTGQLNMPAILAAAQKVGALLYYVEDESAAPLTNIPKSVSYLESLKIAR
jgi:sugar phosphate isomerase/epimerase